ncbi:MAG: TAXI family TRAP transporter solute-binding subunit [Alphaproteobacteria bacterium]|nr:TAXI family TRAP transporter solute-binding subunit [Alphaproteobacteria bacterium]
MIGSRRLLQGLAGIIAGALIAAPLLAQTPPESRRISFQIATGPVTGSYLRVGEAVARIVSNPPGLGRCDEEGVCGPKGLIVTSRSSSGSIANAISVNSGRVKSAIVQGDVARAAFEGTGPFQSVGPLKNLRAIARLHDETLHLVVAWRSRVKRLSDLKGKRVGIDGAKSATNFTVRQIFALAKVDTKGLRLSYQAPEQAANDMRDGKLDAYFVIGATPIRSVDWLVRRGQARVISLDARVIAAAVKKNPMLMKFELPSDTYRSSKAVTTLGVGSVWLVNKSVPNSVVQGILRSLWNPANHGELQRLGPLAQSIQVKKAAENLPVPLHDGAEQFYAGVDR